MSRLNIFLPFSKVDIEKRTVYGIATGELPDRSGEICDYASTRPFYEKWSGDIAKATEGKSLGNVRAMHGKVAAGKLTEIKFDDDAKRIVVAAKIVDDDEWLKVTEGVYTGFSQGGRYVKRWPDEASGLTRYTADPHEISIVDLPCLPDSTFEIVKADGTSETRAFKTVVEAPSDNAIGARAAELAKGGAGKTWRDFLDAAEIELANEAVKAAAKEKLKVDPPLDAATVDPGSANGEPVEEMSDEEIAAASNDHPPKKSPEQVAATIGAGKVYPAAVWAASENGPYFERKVLAARHMKQVAAAKGASSPLTAALEKLEALAGGAPAEKPDPLAAAIEALFPIVAKREFSAGDRKAAAKAGTAMPDGSFPIETKDDLANAIKAYGRAKDKTAAKAHIEARAKALGAESMLPDGWADAAKMAASDLAKGLCDVGSLAETIDRLAWIYQAALWERAYEGDDSTVPDDLCHILRAAGEALIRMAAEEVGELMPDGAEPTLAQADAMALGAGLTPSQAAALAKLSERCGAPFAVLSVFKAPEEPVEKLFDALLNKKGARNSKVDQSKIQAIHDHSMALGAGCTLGNCGKDGVGGDLAKTTLETENAALRKEIADAAARFDGIADTLAKRIANLEAQPAPAKAAITVVGKGDGLTSTNATTTTNPIETAIKALAAMPEKERAHELMKIALANPTTVR
jgi:hypothetical protein